MQRTVRMNHLQNPAEHLGVVFVHMYGRVMKRRPFCTHTTNRTARCIKAHLDETD